MLKATNGGVGKAQATASVGDGRSDGRLGLSLVDDSGVTWWSGRTLGGSIGATEICGGGFYGVGP